MANIDQSENIFVSIGNEVSGALATVKGTLITSFQKEFSIVITTILILAIVIIGYKMIMASYSSQRDFLVTILKLIIVWVLVTVTVEYNGIVSDGVNAAKGFISQLVPLGNSESHYTQLDTVLRKGLERA